jgi:hypothetical protein
MFEIAAGKVLWARLAGAREGLQLGGSLLVALRPLILRAIYGVVRGYWLNSPLLVNATVFRSICAFFHAFSTICAFADIAVVNVFLALTVILA